MMIEKTNMFNTPILLFTYNRLDETRQTVKALQRNIGASESELFVFSDAAKNDKAVAGVSAVREYLKTIDGFKKVTIIERDENYGLAKSIITGVTEIIEQYGSVIVLEDDLITSSNFLSFMNQALDKYRDNEKVWSISGFSFPITYPATFQEDAVCGVRASSWGWATWKDRWDKVDWEISDYDEFLKNRKSQKEFKRGGSDLCKMLNDQMTGKINSWAIRFCYAQYRNSALDVFPKVSKIQNIGFSESATNTGGMDKRFVTALDQSEKTDFNFPEETVLKKEILKQFRKPFSVVTRIQYKLLGMLK